MDTVTFKPKSAVKNLLAVLPSRAREIIIARYGLGSNPEHMTLEAIGMTYGITRERVRQIESAALSSIQKSDVFAGESTTFEELSTFLNSLGGIVVEEEFLEAVSKNKSIQNHTHFLLVLGSIFQYQKEDTLFRKRWYVDEEHATRVHAALKNLYHNLSDDALIPESEFVDMFFSEMKDINKEYRNEEVARRWLSLSKEIGKNPLGEWGSATSSNVRAKGMRDYAYLAIKRQGSPMHFTEVAQTITDLFNRKAHIATCHNELIKDDRFVLIGRGLYALAEWGYSRGVVRDVIIGVLKKHGPLSREDIVDKVRKERHVKDNTILVNLQDNNFFTRDTDGRYLIS